MDWSRRAWETAGPLSRDELCNRLLDLNLVQTRAEGMREIALAQRLGRITLNLPDNKFTPDEEQDRARQYLNSPQAESFFLTGSAGTGKSHLLNELFESQVKRRGRLHVYSTALTGVAASRNRDCTTLHSFAGIQLGDDAAAITVQDLAMRVAENASAMRRWRNCQVLFIDEVSMLDAALLEKLEALARILRNTKRVFGGILVIFVGDFFQLPPVSARNTRTVAAAAQYCFESPVWTRIVGNRYVELKQVFRTNDVKLVQFLGDLRVGNVDRELVEELQNRELECKLGDSAHELLPTILFSRNVDVDRLNKERLDALPNHVTFTSLDWHKEGEEEGCGKSNATLTLAVGAQVILCKNMPKLGLVNGSRGVVVGFEECGAKDEEEDEDYLSSEAFARINPKERLPLVYFLARPSSPVLIKRCEFAAYDGDTKTKLKSSFTLPLRLAWALTIHKSQSQTIDLLHVDLSHVFECGQIFVALSRASSLQGLSIANFPNSNSSVALLCNPKVKAFYDGLKQQAEGKLEPRPCVKRPLEEEEGEDIVWLTTSRRRKQQRQ